MVARVPAHRPPRIGRETPGARLGRNAPVRADSAHWWREGDPLPLPRRRFLNLLGAGQRSRPRRVWPRRERGNHARTDAHAGRLARDGEQTPRGNTDGPFRARRAGRDVHRHRRNIRLLGAEGDLQRPDRVRTAFQAEVMDRAISLQLVTIGDQSWTTNILTGEWENAPLEFAYQPDILFSTQDGIGPVMGASRMSNASRMRRSRAGRPITARNRR